MADWNDQAEVDQARLPAWMRDDTLQSEPAPILSWLAQDDVPIDKLLSAKQRTALAQSAEEHPGHLDDSGHCGDTEYVESEASRFWDAPIQMERLPHWMRQGPWAQAPPEPVDEQPSSDWVDAVPDWDQLLVDEDSDQ